MDLTKLFEMQRKLDARIVKEKGLEGQDLYPNTVLALQAELLEFANEGRWFKHWSENQEPRTEVEVKCTACDGTGDLNYEAVQEDAEGSGNHEYVDCGECDASGVSGMKNPLLEEYVDSLHFFLSIALQKGWESTLYLYEEQLKTDGDFDGGLTGVFLEMLYFLNKSHFEHPKKEEDEKFKSNFGFPRKQYFFRVAWNLFLDIGTHGFGFTFEQIEQAYYAKNAINHTRQEKGY